MADDLPNAEMIRSASTMLGADLRELYNKLYLIDRSTLTPKQKAAWRKSFGAVLDALEAYENRTLSAIVQRLKAEAAQLQAATGTLVDELRGVQEAEKIIGAVGAALGVLAKIVALLS